MSHTDMSLRTGKSNCDAGYFLFFLIFNRVIDYILISDALFILPGILQRRYYLVFQIIKIIRCDQIIDTH